MKPRMFKHLFRLLGVLSLAVCAFGARADGYPVRSSGQTLYLPIYSHVYHGEPGRDGKFSQTLVSVHVSVRNTDPRVPLMLNSARYYDTDGKLLREYLRSPVRIPPLGTHELFVPRADASGGSGANFVLEWKSDSPANPPLVQALHADIREARTLIFTTSALVISPQ